MNWFKKFIDKLAKVNEETFEGKKMDCCDLNRQNVTKNKQSK